AGRASGSPSPTGPEGRPAAATLPVCTVTSVSMPIKDIDTGSRAKKVANSKGHPAIRCMRRRVSKGDIRPRPDQWRNISSRMTAREPGRGDYSGTRREPQDFPSAGGAILCTRLVPDAQAVAGAGADDRG